MWNQALLVILLIVTQDLSSEAATSRPRVLFEPDTPLMAAFSCNDVGSPESQNLYRPHDVLHVCISSADSFSLMGVKEMVLRTGGVEASNGQEVLSLAVSSTTTSTSQATFPLFRVSCQYDTCHVRLQLPFLENFDGNHVTVSGMVLLRGDQERPFAASVPFSNNVPASHQQLLIVIALVMVIMLMSFIATSILSRHVQRTHLEKGKQQFTDSFQGETMPLSMPVVDQHGILSFRNESPKASPTKAQIL